MENWNYKVKIKDVIRLMDNDNKNDDSFIKYKTMLIERFNSYPVIKHFSKTIKRIKTTKSFNKFLDKYYDFCDLHIIWNY